MISRTQVCQPKLRRTIISICDKEPVNFIRVCVLNFLKVNIALRCDTRKIRKHKFALRKLVDRQVPLSGKKQLILQRGVFLLPLLAAVLPTLASLISAK